MRRPSPGRLGERASRVWALAWRDLLDLSRDRRTIAAIVLLPLVGLPGLALLTGVLAQTQEVVLCVRVEDPSPLARGAAERLARDAASILRSWGLEPRVEWGPAPPGGCDIVVVIPEGFSRGLESLNGTAVVLVSSGLTQAGQEALQALRSAARSLGEEVARERVERLAREAGIRVDPARVLRPVEVRVAYHTATGAAAPASMVGLAEAARVLAFSLFFVVNPVIVFASDAVAGERERRTLEALLVSPLTPGELVAAKTLAAGVAGLLGSAADSAGILVFFWMAGYGLRLDAGLALVWALGALGLVLLSSGLAILVASRSGSARSAQNANFLLTTLALLVYFAALSVDYTRLPRAARALLALVPFTHPALALQYYAVGLPREALEYLLLLYASGALSLLGAARLFDPEKALR